MVTEHQTKMRRAAELLKASRHAHERSKVQPTPEATAERLEVALGNALQAVGVLISAYRVTATGVQRMLNTSETLAILLDTGNPVQLIRVLGKYDGKAAKYVDAAKADVAALLDSMPMEGSEVDL